MRRSAAPLKLVSDEMPLPERSFSDPASQLDASDPQIQVCGPEPAAEKGPVTVSTGRRRRATRAPAVVAPVAAESEAEPSRAPPPAEPALPTPLPADLVPIPSSSANLPLDAELARTALWLEAGNIARAAERLGCGVHRLGNFIQRTPSLRAERELARGLIIDRAEGVVLEQLGDLNDPVRRDDAARFVLTTLGLVAGWGSAKAAASGSVQLTTPQGGAVTVRWGDEGPDAS